MGIFHQPPHNMKEMGLTLQERRLVVILRWWVGLFAATAAGFAIFPSEIIRSLNTIGHVFFKWPAPPLTLPSEHFWQIMAVSLLCILTIISFSAQQSIREKLSFVPVIILSKFVTTTGFVIAYFLAGRHFAYFAGAIIDGMIFLITWFCYRRTIASRAL